MGVNLKTQPLLSTWEVFQLRCNIFIDKIKKQLRH